MARISNSKPITRSQIKAIHVAKSRAGIDDDLYREMLMNGWGVASSKGLTRAQANELLTRMGRPLRNPPGSRKPRLSVVPDAKPEPVCTCGNVAALPTPAQRRFIAELVGEIDWQASYESWLRTNMGIDRVKTREQAVRVIEGLKGIKRHAPEIA